MKAILSAFARIRQRHHERKLERLVAETRASFDCEQYRRHRAAALKGRAR